MVVSIPQQVGYGRLWIRAYGVADASARAAVSASKQPIEPGFEPQTALAPPVVHSRHAIESASKAQGPVMSARLLGASARPTSGIVDPSKQEQEAPRFKSWYDTTMQQTSTTDPGANRHRR